MKGPRGRGFGLGVPGTASGLTAAETRRPGPDQPVSIATAPPRGPDGRSGSCGCGRVGRDLLLPAGAAGLADARTGRRGLWRDQSGPSQGRARGRVPARTRSRASGTHGAGERGKPQARRGLSPEEASSGRAAALWHGRSGRWRRATTSGDPGRAAPVPPARAEPGSPPPWGLRRCPHTRGCGSRVLRNARARARTDTRAHTRARTDTRAHRHTHADAPRQESEHWTGRGAHTPDVCHRSLFLGASPTPANGP